MTIPPIELRAARVERSKIRQRELDLVVGQQIRMELKTLPATLLDEFSEDGGRCIKAVR